MNRVKEHAVFYYSWSENHGNRANDLYEKLSLQMTTVAGLFITLSSGVFTIDKAAIVHSSNRGFFVLGLILLTFSILASLSFLFFLNRWHFVTATLWNDKANVCEKMIGKKEITEKDKSTIGKKPKPGNELDWMLQWQVILFFLGIISMVIFGIIQIKSGI